MGRGFLKTGDTGREGGRGTEHFDMDAGSRDAPGRQGVLKILKKAGRPAQVEVGVPGNPDLLKQFRREVT